MWQRKFHSFRSLKAATFGPITMFKEQSLSFHVVSKTLRKIPFLLFPTTSFALLVFIDLVSRILKQETMEANTILKNNVCAGIILMTYANALTRTRFLLKIQILMTASCKRFRINEWNLFLKNILLNNRILIKYSCFEDFIFQYTG